MNWVGHKILSLFPGTQHSVKQKINTTYLLSNVSVLNLVSPQTPIFGLQEATIMASGMFLNILPTQVTSKHLSNIHPKRRSLKTKEVVLLMGILCLISKTQKRETSMNISCVLSRMDSQVLASVELINLLSRSVMQSWDPKWTFALPFLVHKVRPLRRRDNSYPLFKTPYEIPISVNPFRDFSSLLKVLK